MQYILDIQIRTHTCAHTHSNTQTSMHICVCVYKVEIYNHWITCADKISDVIVHRLEFLSMSFFSNSTKSYFHRCRSLFGCPFRSLGYYFDIQIHSVGLWPSWHARLTQLLLSVFCDRIVHFALFQIIKLCIYYCNDIPSIHASVCVCVLISSLNLW